VPLRIRTSGNVTPGTYNINFQGEGPSGTPVHRRTATLDVILPTLDFGVDLLVSDNCSNSITLHFGTAPGATDCYDAGLDIEAPPPPPLDAFDGRFFSCGYYLFTDIRATNPAEERIWDVRYQPAGGCEPISLSWNPSQFPATGYFHLVDVGSNNLVNINMRTTNHYSELIEINHLKINYNYQICSNYSITSGWNMLSLPIDVTNNNYLTLFPGAIPGTLFRYTGGYISTETMNNSSGYWLKFPMQQVSQVCGLDRTESVVTLNAGWNMIGGPNCNVPLSSVTDPGGILIPGTLYGYSGSYSTSTSINGTKGYWVKANGSGTITISCGNVVDKNEEILSKIIKSTEEFGKIEISDAMNNNQTLYFNGKLEENINIESYSMPPLPPAGGFDARLAGDYRLTESDEVNIELQASEYPIRIKVTNLNTNESYVLTEIANGVEAATHKIANGTEIVINNKEVTILKISKEQTVPTTYNLEQNYPNPFNPSTTIKFSIPEATNVRLTIYNTIGEKVGELVNTNLEAGWYSYQWDAENLATGIYIYELRTDKFVSVNKMILMK